MFDRLLLLNTGGKVAYFGDVGPKSQTAMGYFEKHSGKSCPPSANPAEWILDVIHNVHLDTGVNWSQIWSDSAERQSTKSQIKHMIRLQLVSSTTDSVKSRQQASSFGSQLHLVTARLFQHYWRTPSYLYSKALLCIGSVSNISLGKSIREDSLMSSSGILHRRIVLDVTQQHPRATESSLRCLPPHDYVHQSRSANYTSNCSYAQDL